MRILFYLVHPAKYQFHKNQIIALRNHGHIVDIVINTKDVLEELLNDEGWEYTNLFPDGRKIKGVHVYLGAVISMFKAIKRLLKYTANKHYDLYIGDLLTILGRIRRVPSIYFTDDVFKQVPEQIIFFATCNYIIAPKITDLSIFNKKKISYDGYKALSHLHPNYFTPDKALVNGTFNNKKFYFIRCTGFEATHDIGRKGIDNEVLRKIIDLLKNRGDIYISSERKLPEDLSQYEIKTNKRNIYHYMAFSEIFIGDSTTMCTEAALLGTPVVEYDNYWFEIEQMLELQYKYELIYLFQPPNLEGMLNKIEELAANPKAKGISILNKNKLINEKIDVSAFVLWFIENYPQSYQEYRKNQFCQYKFH